MIPDKPVFTLSETTCCEGPSRSTCCLHRMDATRSSETFYQTTRLHNSEKNILHSHCLWTSLPFHLQSSSVHLNCRSLLPFMKTNRHDIHYTITGKHKTLSNVGKKIMFPICSFSVPAIRRLPNTGIGNSLSGPKSYRCEKKRVVTSVSVHSPCWLSPRSPRHGMDNNRYFVTRIIQVFVQGEFFCASKLWRNENCCLL